MKEECKDFKRKSNYQPTCLYGLGFIGAAVYYIGTATGFWMGVYGVVKAIVWPAILAFHAFKYFAL